VVPLLCSTVFLMTRRIFKAIEWILFRALLVPKGYDT
jgi:hypothetical protein